MVKSEQTKINFEKYDASFLETLFFDIATKIKNEIDSSESTTCLIFVHDYYYGGFKLRASTKPGVELGYLLPISEVKEKVIKGISAEYEKLEKEKKEELISDVKIGLNNTKEFLACIPKSYNTVKKLIDINKSPEEGGLNNFGLIDFSICTESSFVVPSTCLNGNFLHPMMSGDRSLKDGDYSDNKCNDIRGIICYYTELKDIGQYKKLKIVVRLEADKDCKKEYSEDHLKDIEKIIDQNENNIASCMFLSSLVSIGYTIDLRELCATATTTLASLVGAKGCSIFLLDEKISPKCILPDHAEEYQRGDNKVLEGCLKKCGINMNEDNEEAKNNLITNMFEECNKREWSYTNK